MGGGGCNGNPPRPTYPDGQEACWCCDFLNAWDGDFGGQPVNCRWEHPRTCFLGAPFSGCVAPATMNRQDRPAKRDPPFPEDVWTK